MTDKQSDILAELRGWRDLDHVPSDWLFKAQKAADELERLRADHTENARILGFLVNELQGRIDGGKLAALAGCRERALSHSATKETTE